jgi:hypothetical protein
MAKVTLSYPGWKEGAVLPATVEVPVEPLSWSALFWDYLIWPLGAAIIVGIGWIIRWVWRCAARHRRTLIEDQRTQQAVHSAAMSNATSRAEDDP